MATYIIELSDANILVAKAGKVVLSSPGYALINEQKVEVGEAAFNQARLHPRHSHNEFWHRLSTDALNNPTPYYRHHADLVHAHLKYIAEKLEDAAEVVFAVPGSYSNDQLALLLGVAQESPLNIVGLVDVAAAVGSVYPLRNPSYFLDISLHQGLISRLDVTDSIKRSQVASIKGLGLTRLYDRWVQLIADAFVEQSRFDPLHNAETEQAIYRQLPQWLAAIKGQDEVWIEIESAAQKFQARLIQSQVIERAAPFYDQFETALKELDVNGPMQLLVSERLANLPGITELLSTHQVVSALDFCRGCDQHLEIIRKDGQPIRFVTALPLGVQNDVRERDQSSAILKQKAGNEAGSEATHLLLGHHAYSLAQVLFVGISGEGSVAVSPMASSLASTVCAIQKSAHEMVLTRTGEGVVLVNGVTVDQSVLKTGDEIAIGDPAIKLTVISEQ